MGSDRTSVFLKVSGGAAGLAGEGTAEVGIIMKTGPCAGFCQRTTLTEKFFGEDNSLVDQVLADGDAGFLFKTAAEVGAIVAEGSG